MSQSTLKSLDELLEQSIYVDTPNQLSSLNTLDKLLNKQPSEENWAFHDKDLSEENALMLQQLIRIHQVNQMR